MDRTLRLIVGAVIPVWRIFLAGRDGGGGYKISERVKRMEGRRMY